MKLSAKEFDVFARIVFDEVGIDLPSSKLGLVQSRLVKRLIHYNFKNYRDYLRLVSINKVERLEMINQITTNETYFFREMVHFELLLDIIKSYKHNRVFRLWSGASSVGAEAYSAAMLLDSNIKQWEVVGSDINTDVIKKARVGLYPQQWIDKIPLEYKVKYCLRGSGEYEGQFLIDRGLINSMKFEIGNLLKHNTNVGIFDVIFLRNVLIYFDNNTKAIVINNILRNLRVGGYLFISLTENLNMLNIRSLQPLGKSVFKKIR